MFSRLFVPVVFLSALLSVAARAGGTDDREIAQSADAFVNSVGVNVHLHYTDTPYRDFPSVEMALKNLGVRHIRESLVPTSWNPFYERLNELGRMGIKAIFVTDPKQSDAVLTAFPAKVPDSFEAYEGPNEYDIRHGPDWDTVVNAFMERLHTVVKSDPAISAFPIIGPSMTQPGSYVKVAKFAPFFDYANLHNYFAGRNPGTPGWGGNGYGGIEWALRMEKQGWPDKPIMTTETGYLNDVTKPQGIPEDVAGKYLPRLLLEHWTHGIQRSYLYQLLDMGNPQKFGDNSFGLLHADFTPKPGYTAIRSLLQLLEDPGEPFQPSSLEYSLSGDTAKVHHALFEKRDGKFFLVVWVELQSYDVDAKKLRPVAKRSITVTTNGPATLILHELNEDGSLKSPGAGSRQSLTFDASDRIAVVEISR